MPLEFADPELETILRSFRLETIHESEDSVYVMRPDLTLVYVNRGWNKFAAENGGQPVISQRWPIGRSIADAIPAVLRPFFNDQYTKCFETCSPWQHRYECSSPDTYREFLMTTYPLGDHQGLLVVNSLYKSSTQNKAIYPPVEQSYCDQNGMIVQCVHCRRIKRPSMRMVWDWVPEWVSSCPNNTSHGLCEPCFGYFYPQRSPHSKGYPQFFRTGIRSG